MSNFNLFKGGGVRKIATHGMLFFIYLCIGYLTGSIDSPRSLNDEKQLHTKDLTNKEIKLLNAYKDNPQLQAAIDKLLDLRE